MEQRLAGHDGQLSPVERWFSGLGSIIETVADHGVSDGVRHAAHLLQLGVAEEESWRVGRGYRGRTSIIQTSGDPAVTGTGEAPQPTAAPEASKRELMVQVVRLFGARIEEELGSKAVFAGKNFRTPNNCF